MVSRTPWEATVGKGSRACLECKWAEATPWVEGNSAADAEQPGGQGCAVAAESKKRTVGRKKRSDARRRAAGDVGMGLGAVKVGGGCLILPDSQSR